MTKERFKFIPAVFLLLEREGKVLLLKRANTGYMDGFYSVPAGHHDGGQTLREAMVREAKEEINLDITPDDLTLVHVMHRMASDGERVDFYFRLTSWNGEPENMEPEKCASLDWVKIDELPENIIPVVRQAIVLAGKGEVYSEANQ